MVSKQHTDPLDSSELGKCFNKGDPAVLAASLDRKNFRMYKDKLSPKLQAAVAMMTSADPDEQVAVFQEIALMRTHASTFVQLYSAVHEKHEKALESGDTEKITKSQSQLTNAGEMMCDVLQRVAETCSKAARVQATLKDRFSLHDLKYVIDRIIAIHWSVCGSTHPEIAEAFIKALDAELQLPTAQAQGTDLHPDDTAREFDASVPYAAEMDPNDDSP